MAQDTQNTQTSTPSKRLARAKIRRPEVEAAKTKADRKKAIRNIAISAFAVLLVLSMMVPYLATIVTSVRNANSAQTVINADEITTEQIDAMYSAGVQELEASLAESPNDLEMLKNLGGQYMSWAYMTGSYATDEGAGEHSAELFAKAQEYYDRYLAIENNNDIRVNRALCDLYAGKFTEAQEALEAVVSDDPECASAWANLGMIYELTNPDAAALAYERAIAYDPDDEAGAKSYAESRLEALTSTEEEATEDTEAVTDDAAAATDDAAANAESEGTEANDTQTDDSGTSN